MLTEAIRRRIERLNRGPLTHALDQYKGADVVPPAPRPRRKREPDIVPGGAFFQLDAGKVISNAAGKHLRLRAPLAQFWPRGAAVVESGRVNMAATRRHARTMHPELLALTDGFPQGALFLDLETCGFAGSMIFLVGLLRQIDGRLVVELLLARTYSEERAVLHSLWQVAAEHQVLVTFNGKSFDWPMVHDRSTLHHLGCQPRVVKSKKNLNLERDVSVEPVESANRLELGRHDPRPELVHCDLLHHARRRWKGRLPNCRLQTLEQFVCGRVREGDIPGSQIPATYHHYVRSGQTTEMGSVLLHNAIDLVTLLDLALRLAVGPARQSA